MRGSDGDWSGTDIRAAEADEGPQVLPLKCPECDGYGDKVTGRRDAAGRYAVQEVCTTCRGHGHLGPVVPWPFQDVAL